VDGSPVSSRAKPTFSATGPWRRRPCTDEPVGLGEALLRLEGEIEAVFGYRDSIYCQDCLSMVQPGGARQDSGHMTLPWWIGKRSIPPNNAQAMGYRGPLATPFAQFAVGNHIRILKKVIYFLPSPFLTAESSESGGIDWKTDVDA